jgi:hypothetical protein
LQGWSIRQAAAVVGDGKEECHHAGGEVDKGFLFKRGGKKNEKGKKELTPTDKQVYVYNINT